jgi:hypothetical protein
LEIHLVAVRTKWEEREEGGNEGEAEEERRWGGNKQRKVEGDISD